MNGWAAEQTFREDEPSPVKPDLLQEIYDKGLLFLVNTNALHHHGYAMGVAVDKQGNVQSLAFYKSDDPDGIWFDEPLMQRGRRRLRAAGLLGPDREEPNAA